MARIELFIPILEKLEGGYVNHPADKGGPTNKGITLKTLRQYQKGATIQDLKSMNREDYTQIIRNGYWDAVKADHISNQSVANIIADFAVNSGPKRAIIEIQKGLYLQSDGIVGPKTLAVLNGPNQAYIFGKIWAIRKEYYNAIVEANKSQKVFYRGWMNRLSVFKYKP